MWGSAVMMTTDQSHLRKYLATLGVAMVAGAISFSGLFLRLQDDLLVSRSDLDDLTPVAQDTIERRQTYLELATTALPWFLIIGCGVGVGLTIYGLVGWAERQPVADEMEDLARDREKAELRRLTDAERVERLEEEAESVAVESVVADSPNDGDPTEGCNAHEATPHVVVADRTRRTSEALGRLLQAEIGLGQKVTDLLGSRYRIELGVQATRGSRRQEFDILARPTEVGEQYVFEIKYTRRLTSAHRSVLDRAITRIAAGASLFELPTVPVVVLIYEESTTPGVLARIRAHGEQLARTFDSSPRVLVLSRQELEALTPEDLGSAIGM